MDLELTDEQKLLSGSVETLRSFLNVQSDTEQLADIAARPRNWTCQGGLLLLQRVF